ncbi:Hpt domain-containing response regulator [Luteimonas sp. e5]
MRDERMNPRLLLVEDDATSQAFLAAAAGALPADVHCAGSRAEALAMAGEFDAWLIDAHLPDGSGIELLAELHARRSESAAPAPFALAHTASRLEEDLERLRAAGFDAAVAKPLDSAQWQAAIREGLAARNPRDWDDAAALRALNDNPEAVRGLRALFLAELPKQSSAIRTALEAGDAARARDELHRLKASCGFVGAQALRLAADALHAAPDDQRHWQRFRDAVARVLAEPAVDR